MVMIFSTLLVKSARRAPSPEPLQAAVLGHL
jgi:hypothetical protein